MLPIKMLELRSAALIGHPLLYIPWPVRGGISRTEYSLVLIHGGPEWQLAAAARFFPRPAVFGVPVHFPCSTSSVPSLSSMKGSYRRSDFTVLKLNYIAWLAFNSAHYGSEGSLP
jgi:hypothetical protein